jgi:hypothetical protein
MNENDYVTQRLEMQAFPGEFTAPVYQAFLPTDLHSDRKMTGDFGRKIAKT